MPQGGPLLLQALRDSNEQEAMEHQHAKYGGQSIQILLLPEHNHAA